MREGGLRRGGGLLVLSGLGFLAVGLVGWLATLLASAWAARPAVIEDLTAVWPVAGSAPLGGSVTVSVPPGETLVAFLVGTDLRGTAGTTTGTCAAQAGAAAVPLASPVLLDFSVDGLFTGNREAVAVAGWRNAGDDAVAVEISCDTADSTVDGFVAVPSKSAAFPSDPWFQPWGWVTLGSLGGVLIVVGLVRLPRESP